MDSYNLHFERMSNVDLHPLSLSVSRLSPAKSNSSIVDHLAHHQHGKGDSAYSSFSGGSTAPDYPSPFLPDDLQSSSFSHYADLKYVKSIYHPNQFLQSDSKTMDQLYRSVEAISQQYRNNAEVNYHSHNGSKSLHFNNTAHPKKEVHSRTPSQKAPAPGYAPPVPARIDSFIATKNLENSGVHLHGTEFKPLPQQPPQQLSPPGQPHSQNLIAPRTEIQDKGSSSLNSEPVYSVWRGPHEMPQAQHPPSYRLHLQLHNQTRPNTENPSIVDNSAASEPHRSANAPSRSPPQGKNQPEHLTPKRLSSSSEFNGDHLTKSSSPFRSERKRAHSAQEWRGGSEPQRPASPRNSSQSFLSSSIKQKGQFYFVTGVYKPSHPGMRTHSATVSGTDAAREVSAALESHCHRDKQRSHSTMDNFFRPLQESPHSSSGTIPEDEEVFISVDQEMDLMFKSMDQENHRPPYFSNTLEESREIGRHTASNPIFYCGPDGQSPPHSASRRGEVNSATSHDLPSYSKIEDHANRGKRQPLEDVASERISKETTPLLYHLTGASRAVFQPKVDPGFSGRKEAGFNKSVQGDVAVSYTDRPAQGDTCQNPRGEVPSVACGTLDNCFKKYYKEKLKDAQSKVLRETSFKRRDLQLPWPHSLTQNSEFRPAAIHSFSSSQDSEISTDTLTPSLTSEDTEKGSIKEAWDNQKEIDKSAERPNGRPSNVAQPQVARIGGRKRLTPEQKKMCFSEPEKLNLIGGTSSHSPSRSFGNESEGLFAAGCEGEEEMQQAEQGLVAARRRMFESRGRALSVSSASKTTLKHLQHQALMEYIERKTGQNVAEPQLPTPHLPTPPRQRHSLGEKPFDWSPRPQSGNQEKPTKKKHHRPHSAGRILDSSTSSVRYAQFFSAQSCSGHYPGHQNPSRPRESQGPAQGKSASAESLLDQRQPSGFLRNRSTSTPQTFQAHDKEEDPLQVNTVETQSCQKKEAEAPSEKRVPEGQQRARKVGQRGKSMEELGASTVTKVSTLSKSSEHLDQLRKNSAEPAGEYSNERKASHLAEDRNARRQEARKEAEFVGENNSQGQGQSQHQTRNNSPERQRPEQGGDAPGERGSARAVSPVSSGEPSETVSNPPSLRGQKTSERAIKSPSSTPTQTKLPCESPPSSSRGGTSPGLEPEQKVDNSISETNHEVSLSCGVTTDPSLWILQPEEELKEDVLNPQLANNVPNGPGSSIFTKQKTNSPASPSTSVSEAEVREQADEEEGPELEAELVGEKEETEDRGTPEGEINSSDRPAKKPKWEELVKAVVKADQSLARVLCPVANRKTALMLMEQLLSEDTLLMEEHYKKKQEQKGAAESEGAEPSPCLPDSDGMKSQCTDEQSEAEITEKKRLLVLYINEHLRSLEESRGALQTEVGENAAVGEAMKLLVHERCLPVELERYNLFIGDLERVVNLLLCLSARLARVQNALSVVDQHTDAEEKESLDSRHRLLCKQREDAKDLKDNLDRRENLVSTFLSRQLSAEQLQDYRRFVQTKASLLIRQKDLEEKQRLGEEQLEALSNSLNI